ncbi:unnamed protein product [Clavelina lepadiformis]|uniref:Fe2OG dioxygenase domain-containing protein n=1 Tax=Clavelina lepadiformis TaxID=159417 RepID=A0ABP0H6J9_CLALP
MFIYRPTDVPSTHKSASISWAGKQTDTVVNKSLSFQNVPPQDLKEPPKLKYLRENGEHILGSTDRGCSKVILNANFIPSNDADWMFETLLNEIQWKQQKNLKYGPDYKEPRLTEWFSNHPYHYSGVEQAFNPHWHPLLTALCDRINQEYRLHFNAVLANCYRDGHDSVDWHTDSEPALGNCPPIASLSFGDTRNFDLREIPATVANGDFTYSQQFRIPLSHGTLLLMLGATQHDWQHRVPKEYHDRKPRINLTFRTMHPSR